VSENSFVKKARQIKTLFLLFVLDFSPIISSKSYRAIVMTLQQAFPT
jgi:hypothetical protein